MSKKNIKEILKNIDQEKPNFPDNVPGSGDFSEGIPRDLPNKIPDIPAMFAPDDWPDPPSEDERKK